MSDNLDFLSDLILEQGEGINPILPQTRIESASKKFEREIKKLGEELQDLPETVQGVVKTTFSKEFELASASIVRDAVEHAQSGDLID